MWKCSHLILLLQILSLKDGRTNLAMNRVRVKMVWIERNNLRKSKNKSSKENKHKSNISNNLNKREKNLKNNHNSGKDYKNNEEERRKRLSNNFQKMREKERNNNSTNGRYLFRYLEYVLSWRSWKRKTIWRIVKKEAINFQ